MKVDGSVDIYFGLKAPEGKKTNWLLTVPFRRRVIALCMYGPLKPTWRPGEIELVK